MLQRHDRDEKLNARCPAGQRHIFIVTHLMEQGFDRHRLLGWRPIHHEAGGIQGIGESLVGDRGNGDKAIGSCVVRGTPQKLEATAPPMA